MDDANEQGAKRLHLSVPSAYAFLHCHTSSLFSSSGRIPPAPFAGHSALRPLQ